MSDFIFEIEDKLLNRNADSSLVNFYIFVYLFLFELLYFSAEVISIELIDGRYWLTGCCTLLASALAVLWHLDSFTTGTSRTTMLCTRSSACLRTSLVSVFRPVLKGWQTLLAVMINERCWYNEIWQQRWILALKTNAYNVVHWAGWITQRSLPLHSIHYHVKIHLFHVIAWGRSKKR